MTTLQEALAAIQTLKNLGYTWLGGELWKPPLGTALPQKERPDFMAGYDAGMADAKRMAQQGEPVYQYQMADGSWIDQIKDSYDYNRKYAPNATVRVVYTAAPAPQSQEPAEWRTEAVKWIRRKAEDQRAKNEQNPRHAEAYPSWGERVRQWHWLADDLEMEQNSPPFGLESYQEPEPQPAQGDCGKLKELVRKSGAVVFDKDGSYGNYQGGSILFSPSQWESFANGLTLQKEITK